MRHLSHNIDTDNSSNVRFIEPDASVVREREFLFRMGDQLEGIYKVNSGCIKLSRSTQDGEHQIIGFYMAGDLIGVDALADGISHSTAVVLETANITLIPFKTLLNRDGKFDSFAFIHQVGVNFNHDNDHTMMLSQPAGRRLAWFLTEFSDKLSDNGMLATEFRMPMTCADVAFYLGMASETLSRQLKDFCEQGLVRKHNRDIELLDIDALKKIANAGFESEEKSARSNRNHNQSTTMSASRSIH